VKETDADGITVTLDGLDLPIKTRDLGVTREEQDPTRYKPGQTVQVKITTLSAKDRKISVSIRALQQDEERAAVAEYSQQEESSDNVFAAALKNVATKPAKKAKTEAADEAAPADAAPKAKKAPAKKKADATAE
jgi:small subunit ribosomal protein S1